MKKVFYILIITILEKINVLSASYNVVKQDVIITLNIDQIFNDKVAILINKKFTQNSINFRQQYYKIILCSNQICIFNLNNVNLFYDYEITIESNILFYQDKILISSYLILNIIIFSC